MKSHINSYIILCMDETSWKFYTTDVFCVCVVHGCAQLWMDMQKLDTSSVFLYCFLICFLRSGLSLCKHIRSSLFQLGCLANKQPGTTCTHYTCWATGMHDYAQPFRWLLEIWTQVLLLTEKALLNTKPWSQSQFCLSHYV